MSYNNFNSLPNQSLASFQNNKIIEYDFNEPEKTNRSSLSGYFICNRTFIIVFANIIALAALGAIGLAIGLGINSATPKTFGSSCVSTSDCKTLSTYGLICNNNNCTCVSSSYYDGSTCSPVKGYQSTCKSTSECNSTLILSCVSTSNGYQCGCSSTRYWNGQYCQTLLTKSSNCTSDSECQQSLGLICNNTCICPSTSFWNGVKCDTLKTFNQGCTSNSSCDNTKSLYCIETGQNPGVCTCGNLQYWDSVSSTCLSQKTFNTSCTLTSQCRTDLGLSCSVSNFCTCDSNYYWSGSSCVKTPSISGGCSLIVPCDSTILLTCISNTCQCPSTHYWDGSGCSAKASIGSSCTSASQCLDSSGLNCSSAFCVCGSNYYWDSSNSTCVAKLTESAPCISTTQCQIDKLLSCTSGKCQCAYTNYWDGTTCATKLSNGQACTSTSMCQSYFGLTCTSLKCSCPNTQYWNGASCVAKKNYTDTCSSSTECNDLIGLACSTTAGACDCPAKTIVNMCDCTSGYYYDINQGSCVTQKLNNNTCTATYECKVSGYLSCVSGSCECPSGPLWFWSTSSSTCIECPSGWDIYKSHCYYVSRSALSWDDALIWCRNQSAEFMIINDDDEYKLLYNYYVTYFGSGNLWIGAKSPTPFDFRWPDNTQLSRYSPWWCSGEPNNAGGNAYIVREGCAFMWTAGGRICFNDYPCWAACPFVCEKNS